MPSPALSKSLFKLGLTCPIKLKHALAQPALPRQADGNEYMQQLARGGYMFEKLVKVYYPGEDMFVLKESHTDASARTLAKIKAGGFEGKFDRAAEIFTQMSTQDAFEEFLTLPLYEEI